jgi:serine/threonine-protein kinase
MGEVFLGHDPRLERRVALKCLIVSGATRDEDQARMLREARAAARLNHPNIAAVYDVLQEGDRTFIVMEYVEGESLASRMARERIPIAQVRTIGRQLSSALAAAHAQGVIHRDLKPANIHVALDGTIKVLDFGVAKLEHSGTPPHERTLAANPGTTIYMSPEQLFGQPLDPRSDIYSAGVILYELATCQRPFDELNPVALALAMQSRDPVPPHVVSPDVPHDLSDIIMKMLARDAVDRFQSIREVEALLTTTFDAESGVSHSSVRPRVRRWTPVWMGVSAAAVLLALAFAGRPLIRPAAPAPTALQPVLDSIAVLPLENLSADPNQEYIADGMTESIITELGHVRSLRVISRQSMMQFKHTNATVPQIATQLGVHAVMTGSVTRAGDRLRVTVALMEPSPEHQVWAETYDRTVGDLLTLSSEVAQTAVKAVRVIVTPDEQAQLAQARPMRPDAQQEYLLGRFSWNKRTKADNEAAMQHFSRAIQLDSTAARAYAGLADCYIVAIDNGWVAPEEAYRVAKANASKALELDDRLAEAHATLGSVYRFTLLWPQAEEEFKRALALNPGYATARQWYSIELRSLGRFSEAVAEARRALDIDPLSPVQNLFLANQLYYAGDYDAVVNQINKAQALAPDSAIAHQLLGATYVQLKNYPAAIRELTSATRMNAGDAGNLGHAYAVSGNRGAATRILNDLLRRSEKEYVRPLQIAMVYVGLGDSSKALEFVERAYRENEGVVSSLATDPRLTTISGDPRFQSILRRGGLTYRHDLAAH